MRYSIYFVFEKGFITVRFRICSYSFILEQERLLIDVDYTDESGWQWTVPKIIGIAAGGLCVTAILAAFIQYQLRRREKEIANKLRAQE